MEELVKWLKDNIGTDIRIITPQFERPIKREYEWVPETDKQFYAIVNDAPWDILRGLGFAKWDTMNSVIGENSTKPKNDPIEIPFLNSDDTLKVDVGYGEAPTEQLEPDEDIILFPGEWYDVIPDGFIVTGLYGEQYPFKKGDTDDDIRFGCLAYGIRRKIWRKNDAE